MFFFHQGTEQAAEDAGSSWTGWAVTSITSKLYKGGQTPTAAGDTSMSGAGEQNPNTQKSTKGSVKVKLLIMRRVRHNLPHGRSDSLIYRLLEI
jgi:hypothetical protein